MLYAALGIAAALLVLALIRLGRAAAAADISKEALDDIGRANKARDSLRADPAAAKRVRARFTR